MSQSKIVLPLLIISISFVFGKEELQRCVDDNSDDSVNSGRKIDSLASDSARGSCQIKDRKEELPSPRRPCPASVISLSELEEKWRNPEQPKMFFIESSGRPTLNHRQVCSIESAVRNAGKLFQDIFSDIGTN